MAHLVETMMSANAVVPWHKLGNILDGYPTVEEAYEKSGLDWKVVKQPLFVQGQDGFSEVPCFGIIRDSDNEFLGACSDRYQLFQNSEAFDWCKPLVESGEWRIETAGALKRGQVCWILLSQGSVSILPQDKLNQYLLLTFAHDGKTAVRLGLTSVRVVCNNTLTQALNLDGKFLQKFMHNSALTLRLEDAKALYSESARKFNQQVECFGKLADRELQKSEIDDFIYEVALDSHKITEEDDLEDMSEKRKKSLDRTIEQINWFRENGLGQKELKLENNLWGVFNAVEAWTEKARQGKRVQDRGYDILFGRGKQIVDKAFGYAMSI